MHIVVGRDAGEVRGLMRMGYCPVGCSIGGEIVEDDLRMGHHGAKLTPEPSIVRAYKDHFGCRRDDSKFVVTGQPTTYDAFVVATLMGVVPHQSVVVPDNSSPRQVQAFTRDLTPLVKTLCLLHFEPIGHTRTQLRYGDMITLHDAMTVDDAPATPLAWATAVGLWERITKNKPSNLDPVLYAAKRIERERRDSSLCDDMSSGESILETLRFVPSTFWGFPEWYQRQPDEPYESPKGWNHPTVVRFNPEEKTVTVGCPNNTIARELFGSEGLLGVAPHLQPEGWGGRADLIGSPRGLRMSIEQARAAASAVASRLLR